MDLKLDSNGHLVIENGDLVLVDGIEAIAQDIACELRRWLGEDVYQPDDGGTPYEQVIFAHGTTDQAVRDIIEQKIRLRDGVQDMLELNAARDRGTRSIRLNGRVKAIDQEIPVDLEIGS